MLSPEEIAQKMIFLSAGSTHDINHFLKVSFYARIIGKSENLFYSNLLTLEIAALVHDIACPKLRELYKNANGKLQEEYGPVMIKEEFNDEELKEPYRSEVLALVAVHHTFNHIINPLHQYLIEADYIVNAEEMQIKKDAIVNFLDKYFKSRCGIDILNSVFKL